MCPETLAHRASAWSNPCDHRRPLAEPTEGALEIIAAHGPIVEIGAGEGAWAAALRQAGVQVRAFDVQPRGEGVELGDHTIAARHAGAMLAVWPPDGTEVQRWISATDWPTVLICASWPRIEVGDTLAAYDQAAEVIVDGRKGLCRLRAFVRRP